MSASSFLIFNLLLLAVVLESDLGRRKISLFRVIRPLVGAAAIAPFFIAAPATSWWGLTLELGGAAAGLCLGLAAAALLPVRWDPQSRRACSYGGAGYAALCTAASWRISAGGPPASTCRRCPRRSAGSWRGACSALSPRAARSTSPTCGRWFAGSAR